MNNKTRFPSSFFYIVISLFLSYFFCSFLMISFLFKTFVVFDAEYIIFKIEALHLLYNREK